MKLVCPKCNAKILPASVNIATDLAKCDNCQEILKASVLAEEVESTEELLPPAGSRIRVEGGPGNVRLLLPPAGFSWGLLPPLIFCVFWLGFITFWTWGASRAGGAFALFSIPFWCVGAAMLGGLFNSICERQQLDIASGKVLLRRIRPFFPATLEIPTNHVSKIEMDEVAIRNPFAMARHIRRFPMGAWGGIPQAIITHGTSKTSVGEHLSEPEQEWLVRALKILIRQASRSVASN